MDTELSEICFPDCSSHCYAHYQQAARDLHGGWCIWRKVTCSVVDSRAVVTGFFLLPSIFHLHVSQGSTVLLGPLRKKYSLNRFCLSFFLFFLVFCLVAATGAAFGMLLQPSPRCLPREQQQTELSVRWVVRKTQRAAFLGWQRTRLCAYSYCAVTSHTSPKGLFHGMKPL